MISKITAIKYANTLHDTFVARIIALYQQKHKKNVNIYDVEVCDEVAFVWADVCSRYGDPEIIAAMGSIAKLSKAYKMA